MTDKYENDRFTGHCPTCGQSFLVEQNKKLVEALRDAQEFFETNAFRMDNCLDMQVRESIDEALAELEDE